MGIDTRIHAPMVNYSLDARRAVEACDSPVDHNTQSGGALVQSRMGAEMLRLRRVRSLPPSTSPVLSARRSRLYAHAEGVGPPRAPGEGHAGATACDRGSENRSRVTISERDNLRRMRTLL